MAIRFAKTLTASLIIALVCHQTVMADSVEMLKITVLEGEGAFNNSKGAAGHNPVVLVQDQSDRPVAGARVTFLLPETGQGGVFAHNGKVFSTTTDAVGRAATTGFRPNSVEGSFDIRVQASYGGVAASTLIPQSNTSAISSSGVGRKVLWLTIAGAAAGGLVAVMARRGGSSPAVVATPTGVSTGPISVAGTR
jgi:hypothetical protein